MNYNDISKNTMSHLYKSYMSLKDSPLDTTIRTLIEIRVSQINGCAYCCALHLDEARKINILQEKLDTLPAWFSSDFFTVKEKAALSWCEAVTRAEKDCQNIRNALGNYFTEREIVDLTICISIMNALNRIAVSLKEC